MKWTGWILARLFAVAGVLVVLAIVLLAILGFTATGNQFLAEQIASRISTPDMQVHVDGARGLLSGKFRMRRIVLADTRGTFGEVDDLQIDWSPMDLLTAEFDADRIAASAIRLPRPPVKTVESQPSEGSFRLPVEIDVRRIDLPVVSLGPEVLGKSAEIALAGSARGAEDRIALILDAREKEGARAVGDLAYAVNARTLKVALDVDEPAGGLVTTLLKLPGNPALGLSISGDGPLDSWKGRVRASLDGVERLALDGSHAADAAGVHRVVLSGGGAIGELVPPALRTMFEGESAIDIDASFSAAGMLDIRSARIANGSLSLDVSGAVDPGGEARLNGSIRPAGEVLAIRWPLDQGMLEADLANAAFTASGPFRSVAFELSASLKRAAVPAGGFADVLLRLGSDSFDLATRSGQLSTEVTAETAAFVDPQLSKLVRGPIRITAPVALTATGLRADPLEISSGALGATAALAHDLQTGAFDVDFTGGLASAAFLPPDLAAKAGPTFRLSGRIAGTLDNMAFRGVRAESSLASLALDGTLVGDALSASLSGDVPALAALDANLDGRLALTATLSGPLRNLKIDTRATSERIVAAGRPLEDVDLVFGGQFDPAAPRGSLSAVLGLDGTRVTAKSDVALRDGSIALSAIDASIGGNTLTGSLDLAPDFLPRGRIDATLADLATLGRLAGQAIEGDLKLAIDLKPAGGKLGATLSGQGGRVASQDVVLTSPTVALESSDLAAQTIKGRIAAASLAAGGTTVERPILTVDHRGLQTGISLDARLDGAPLAAAADIQRSPAGIDIMLRDANAAPRGLPLALAEPAFILLRDGRTTIESLRLAMGSGTVTLAGTVADTLDLDVKANAISASVANGFSPGLDASGTLAATARITGRASAPVVAYEFTGNALATRALIEAGRRPLDLSGKGTFENGLVTVSTAVSGIDETGEITADAAIRLAGPDLRIEKLDLSSDALSGSVTGNYQTATKALAADIRMELSGRRLLPPALQVRLDGPVRVTGTISGTPDNLAFNGIKLTSNLLTADLSGSLTAGVIDATASATLADLAALQPDIAGQATLSATVSGPVARPSVRADITASDATLVGRKLQSLTAVVEGVADMSAPSGRLQASGTIDGQVIDISGQVASADGKVRIPDLKAIVGRNSVAANLALDEGFIPAGSMRFDLPDIGLIAALAGQKASGDLWGEATLENAGGVDRAVIRAEGTGLSSAGLSVRMPVVDLDIPDLKAGRIAGEVKAAELAFGANRVTEIDATFSLDGPKTDFRAAAIYDGSPVKAEGSVLRTDGAIDLTIASLAAAPAKLPVSLSAPATIRIAGGTVDLGKISLLAAGGRIDISGTVSDRLDLTIDAPAVPAELANIVSPGLDASGTLEAQAKVTGTTANPVAEFTAEGRKLTARPLRDAGRDPLDISASGRFQGDKLSARARIVGIRELGTSELAADLTLRGGSVTADTISLTSPVLTARGDATLQGDRLSARLDGSIVELAAFLPQAKGKADFRMEAEGPLSGPQVKLHLEAENVVTAGKRLDRFSMDATALADPQKPSATARATGAIDGQPIDINAEVVTDQGRISIPVIQARVGANTISGAITLGDANLPTGRLTFDLPEVGLLAALAGQAAEGQLSGSLDLSDAGGKLTASVKASGEGITAQGVRIARPDIDLTVPDLLAGQISGTIRAADIVSGTNRLANLDARFSRSGAVTDFDVKGSYDGAPLTASGAMATRPEGLAVRLDSFAASPRKIPVRLSAPVTINTGSGGAEIRGLRIATGNGAITVDGTAGERLDLRIKVASLPASLANTFAGGLDASGTIGADATVTGTTSRPLVNFTANWQNAMTSQIRAAGLPALRVDARGKLDGTRLSIDTNVTGGGGLTLKAAGTVETGGNQALDLSVKGRLPFEAVASQLAAQGLALKGNASFDLRIGGSTARPDINGRITTANAQFIAIRQNLVVNAVAATVALRGQTATIESLSGNLEGGGRISGSGTVGFAPGSGLPADLAIKLERATYADGRVVVAKVSGDLTIKGPLQREATLGGAIRLRRADITIPERLPASLANANVKHRNAPADVARQSREIRADTDSKADSSKGGGMRLDLRISAPRQIFVRGRGLDAELGGEVRITGSSGAPDVSGGFRMIRGRLTIVGRRLDFTTGEITFGGGLVPYLNMVASSTVNATTLNVNVVGLANDPDFSFTSSPALPPDEVLAQLIFGRESSSLSPFQIAQLADAVATLSGGQRTSLFDKLRQGLGIDDLNVGTDENGGAQVTAGKYLNRRTYLELKQGENESESGVAINLDIGKGVKLRGEATANGGTSTGIFYEKEY